MQSPSRVPMYVRVVCARVCSLVEFMSKKIKCVFRRCANETWIQVFVENQHRFSTLRGHREALRRFASVVAPAARPAPGRATRDREPGVRFLNVPTATPVEAVRNVLLSGFVIGATSLQGRSHVRPLTRLDREG